jgi:hypothetical protein
MWPLWPILRWPEGCAAIDPWGQDIFAKRISGLGGCQQLGAAQLLQADQRRQSRPHLTPFGCSLQLSK